MPNNESWIAAAERGCLAILLLWLAALPLPFGSMIEEVRAPLIVVPIVITLIAALLRLYVIRDRTVRSQPTRPWLIWASGVLLIIGIGVVQLIPLPPSLLRIVSPESNVIWTAASRVASFAGVQVGSAHPITIDPDETSFEVLRLAALLATFTASTLLARTNQRRVAMAIVFCGTALFEAMYGLREAALQRYEIWGWVNRLIFNRVTGTFVNPNHFAHYMALVLPMPLFIGALAWHRSGSSKTPVTRRLVHLVERDVIRTSLSIVVAIVCLIAILLAQSRGALLALGIATLAIAGFLPGRRFTRIAFGATAGVLVVVALVVFLGPERTIRRFVPSKFEQKTLVGRRVGVAAAANVWKQFPIFGSGLGTFDRAVYMEQKEDLELTYHHAHNDYMEIAATGGAIAFVIAIGSLVAGYVALLRMTFGAEAEELTWSRRAYQVIALMSLTIAMVHSLFDFNFFIPSNAATLAAILGGAVSVHDHDKRTRR